MTDHSIRSNDAAAPPPVPKSLGEAAFDQWRRLANDPNICAVGSGTKLRAGQVVGTHTLVFFVREKLAGESAVLAKGSWPVPRTVDGFATDVVAVGTLEAAAADRTAAAGKRATMVDAPLVGGVATSALGSAIAGPGGYGTLGGLCFDNATRAPLVISNAHVWGQTAGTEVVQPVVPSEVLGAGTSPAMAGTPSQLVQTRVPPGLTAPVVFANSIAQTYLIAGSDVDPLVAGQTATPVSPTTRTDSEQVTLTAAPAGFPPAGVRLAPSVAWAYQRLSSTAVAQSSSNAVRPITKLLAARRLFTNAASYSGNQTVSLYAEIIPAGGAATATAHHALVLLYPLPAGDKFIPRVLRPTARQAVTTVTTAFSGFPAPARAGTTTLPAVAGAFTVDAAAPATFATGAGLPAGTFALRLPAGSVRLFVPPSTQIVLDIDVTQAPGYQTQSFNSARDPVAVTVGTAAGPTPRTLVTISGSEIVEVVLSGATNAVLFGVTSRRASPEPTAPLCYSGTVAAPDLLPKGKWGASLFVQAVDTGAAESANIVETAIGMATLVSDCLFDVV